MVAEAPDPVLAFAEYAQQITGVPWPTIQDYKILRREVNVFFEHYPHLDYYTLCRVAQWCAKRKKRPNRVWRIVGMFRAAWSDGALPELAPADRSDENVEERIRHALHTETCQDWRRRLLGAAGLEARRRAICEWEARYA